MHINWIDLAGLLIIVWLAIRQASSADRIKKLEAAIRLLEVQCNTQQMNIKKLYHFRDVEVHMPNETISAEDRQGLAAEFAAEIDRLAERNKLLMS